MWNVLSKLYDDLSDDGSKYNHPNESNKLVTSAVSLQVGSIKVKIKALSMESNGKLLRINIPRIAYKLPIVSVLVIQGVKSEKDIEANVSKALRSSECYSLCKEYSVMAFMLDSFESSDSGKAVSMLYSAVDLGEHASYYSKGETLTLENGMWFTDHKLYWSIQEDQYSNYPDDIIPLVALSKIAKKVLSYYPDLQEWVQNHPSKVEDPIEWWKKFASVALLSGWHLAWRGTIFTSHYSSYEVSQALYNNLQGAQYLNWPENARIIIKDVKNNNEYDTIWGQLISGGKNPLMELQSCFQRSVVDVYNKYKNKLVDLS